jgi:hypothetical protein
VRSRHRFASVAAIFVAVVGHFLVVCKTVFLLGQLPNSTFADRGCATHRIGDNRENNSAHVEIENKALRQPRCVGLQCVGHVIAFDWAIEVVEDGCDVGAPSLSVIGDAAPALTTGDQVAPGWMVSPKTGELGHAHACSRTRKLVRLKVSNFAGLDYTEKGGPPQTHILVRRG